MGNRKLEKLQRALADRRSRRVVVVSHFKVGQRRPMNTFSEYRKYPSPFRAVIARGP
jgi:hypothetical protein